jgi:predicted phosphate transport protein (TIGR00153 family)
MRSIAGLFSRSPFSPLQQHIDEVADCVAMVPDILAAFTAGDAGRLEVLAEEVSKQEHQADLVKNEIRNHMPKSLFMPVARGSLLEILALQDDIADAVEDLASLLTLRKTPMIIEVKGDLHDFVAKNLEAFELAKAVIHELDRLLETGFGGQEARRVTEMVERVAFKEHEADIIQVRLLKYIMQNDGSLSPAEFYLWSNMLSCIAAISNQSENLALRVRMTLDLK